MTKKTSAAQAAASARYRAKKAADSCRLPTGFISPDLDQSLADLARAYGSKKDAVVVAIGALSAMEARKKASLAYKKARAELDELLQKPMIKVCDSANAAAVGAKLDELRRLRVELIAADREIKGFYR